MVYAVRNRRRFQPAVWARPDRTRRAEIAGAGEIEEFYEGTQLEGTKL